MMREVNLLKALPVARRNIEKRREAKSLALINLSKQYGRDYFDGDREVGYGGYSYDGRWVPVAYDIIEFYKLGIGAKVLDVGAAKGFLVKDLLHLGIDAYGLDISPYALLNCENDVVGRMHLGSAEKLPFPDKSFDLVLSINTIHNLPRDKAVTAISEINRVSRGNKFVQVDSFHTEEQKAIFESWVLTAEFYDYPEGWLKLFTEAGYDGDYFWTVV